MQETGPGAGWAVHWDPHHEAPFMYRWVGVTRHITRAVSVNFNNVSEVYPDIRAQSAELLLDSRRDGCWARADTAWQHYRLQTAAPVSWEQSLMSGSSQPAANIMETSVFVDCRD